MRELIAQRKAPRGATMPEKVEMAGVFLLDVNNAIWQDVGLAGEDLTDPLSGMCDDVVHRGIKALLEVDRCGEEEAHLVHERRALQVWFSEQWKIVMEGCAATGAYYYIFSHRPSNACHFERQTAYNINWSFENKIFVSCISFGRST